MNAVETIFSAKPDTPKGDQLELLSLLIEQYENRYYPISAPDPIEAIKFRIFRQTCLCRIINWPER